MKAGSKAVPKKKWTCWDGPMVGHELFLASAFTAYLNFNGNVGRYMQRGHVLVWEPKHAS